MGEHTFYRWGTCGGSTEIGMRICCKYSAERYNVVNNTIYLTITLLVNHVVLGGCKKSIVLSIQIRVLRYCSTSLFPCLQHHPNCWCLFISTIFMSNEFLNHYMSFIHVDWKYSHKWQPITVIVMQLSGPRSVGLSLPFNYTRDSHRIPSQLF